MNADRRKRIAAALDALAAVRSDIEGLAEEEREAFDNMPEGLQESDRGCAMNDAADALESAAGELENIADSLGELS